MNGALNRILHNKTGVYRGIPFYFFIFFFFFFFFFFLIQNKDCGYSLEPPRLYQQSIVKQTSTPSLDTVDKSSQSKRLNVAKKCVLNALARKWSQVEVYSFD